MNPVEVAEMTENLMDDFRRQFLLPNPEREGVIIVLHKEHGKLVPYIAVCEVIGLESADCPLGDIRDMAYLAVDDMVTKMRTGVDGDGKFDASISNKAFLTCALAVFEYFSEQKKAYREIKNDGLIPVISIIYNPSENEISIPFGIAGYL